MNKRIVLSGILFAIVLISGCRGGGHAGVYVEENHPRSPEVKDSKPYLIEFNIIDSFGINTEHELSYIPSLDPYLDDGIFDVTWEVDAVHDYIVEYRLNDLPAIEGSYLIDAELCGPGLPCNRFGQQFCQYQPDYSLSCDVANAAYSDLNSTFDPLFIDDIVVSYPEPLFFILQICDTALRYCEYDIKSIDVY